MSTENTGRENCFEIVTKQRVYQLSAKSQDEMLEWMKTLNVHTQLHIENEYIHQAEEMIAKASLDKYSQQFGQDLEESVKKLEEFSYADISKIMADMDQSLKEF